MQQLTCLVLDNPALDQDVLSVAAGICSLRRLYASVEWAVLPAGPWQHTVRSLASACCSCWVHPGLSWAGGGGSRCAHAPCGSWHCLEHGMRQQQAHSLLLA